MKPLTSKIDFIVAGGIYQSLRRAGYYANSAQVRAAAFELGIIPHPHPKGKRGIGYTAEEANQIRQRIIEVHSVNTELIPVGPTLDSYTDMALVNELRSRGWEVTATRTRTETL